MTNLTVFFGYPSNLFYSIRSILTLTQILLSRYSSCHPDIQGQTKDGQCTQRYTMLYRVNVSASYHHLTFMKSPIIVYASSLAYSWYVDKIASGKMCAFFSASHYHHGVTYGPILGAKQKLKVAHWEVCTIYRSRVLPWLSKTLLRDAHRDLITVRRYGSSHSLALYRWHTAYQPSVRYSSFSFPMFGHGCPIAFRTEQ